MSGGYVGLSQGLTVAGAGGGNFSGIKITACPSGTFVGSSGSVLALTNGGAEITWNTGSYILNPDDIAVPAAGYYSVTASVRLSPDSVSRPSVEIDISGAGTGDGDTAQTYSEADSITVNVTGVVYAPSAGLLVSLIGYSNLPADSVDYQVQYMSVTKIG